MQLFGDDIAAIVQQLPPFNAGDERIASLANNLEHPRSVLFAAAANLQLRAFSDPSFIETPRARHMTFGFISLGMKLDYQYIRSKNFAFGVSLHVKGGPSQEQSLLGEIVHADVKFPIIATPENIELHNPPPHPGSPSGVGSSCCWARPKSTGAGWTHGILTASHVVSNLSNGTAIYLDPTTYTSPDKGWLQDPGECPVDAAVIDIMPADWPATVSPMVLSGPFPFPGGQAAAGIIAPGDAVMLGGRHTQASGKVLSHLPLAHYWGAMMGQRLVVDVHGQGGDSGALVTHIPSSSGAGLYMGRINDGAKGHNGLCQDLYQAAIYLDLDLFI